jgi:putative FmdB family regulatory protein
MPIYEYQCDSCGDVFEVRQKFADEPLTTHDKCGGAVHRLLSAPALQFKGSGWYITDYARSGGGAKESKSDSKSESKTSNGSSSSESKPSTSDSSASTKSESK